MGVLLCKALKLNAFPSRTVSSVSVVEVILDVEAGFCLQSYTLFHRMRRKSLLAT